MAQRSRSPPGTSCGCARVPVRRYGVVVSRNRVAMLRSGALRSKTVLFALVMFRERIFRESALAQRLCNVRRSFRRSAPSARAIMPADGSRSSGATSDGVRSAGPPRGRSAAWATNDGSRSAGPPCGAAGGGGNGGGGRSASDPSGVKGESESDVMISDRASAGEDQPAAAPPRPRRPQREVAPVHAHPEAHHPPTPRAAHPARPARCSHLRHPKRARHGPKRLRARVCVGAIVGRDALTTVLAINCLSRWLRCMEDMLGDRRSH